MDNSNKFQEYNKLLNNMENLIKITNKCNFIKGKIICGRMNNITNIVKGS